MVLGSTKDRLKSLLETDGAIDIFCRDNEHTFATMWFELHTAWPYLKEDGLVICDKFESCNAFFDFCRKLARIALIMPKMDREKHSPPNFGIISK